MARDLWEGAADTASITVKFNDLSKVKWASAGPKRNQSLWMDSA